jgi:hypothetical protein
MDGNIVPWKNKLIIHCCTQWTSSKESNGNYICKANSVLTSKFNIVIIIDIDIISHQFSSNVRLCSLLPTIQAKAALILKNKRFLITYTAYYPMLFFLSVSQPSITARTAYGVHLKIFFTFCAISETQCVWARRCKARVCNFLTQVSTWSHNIKKVIQLAIMRLSRRGEGGLVRYLV